ncbi:MAG: carbohydrate ABC transporter substrate-binding protein [Lachnospiraceae bacterium]|nr:carbohydrate ABC transporter substrate-binding protein [Lachnospiraceae bacterium]
MKKLLAMGLSLTMVLSLAACGSKEEPKQEQPAAEEPAQKEEAPAESEAEAEAPTEEADSAASDLSASITLWTYPIGNWGNSETVDSLVASFNQKYPGITVTVEYLDYTNGDDQVNTAIEGGQAPDIVMEGPERLVANWGARGLMVDLSDLFATEAGGEIYDSVESACKAADGAYYEYPLCMVAHCMAINQNMFEAADAMQYLDAETHTWTTENFLKAVQAVYDSGQQNVGAIYCSGQGGDQGTRALINNLYSGTFTDAEHTKYTADSDVNIKALETLYAQDGINFDASINGGEEITLFRNGTLAMSFCWNAAQQTNSDNAAAGTTNNGDTILPMLFPSDDGKTELCGGIWGFGVFDNGDQAKIDAAKTFIDFICNDPDQVNESVKASTYFPVRPTLTGIYDGMETADTMNTFSEYFMPSMGDYYQVVPGWAEARTAWWNMLQRIGTGGDVATEVGTFVTEANTAAGSN